MRSHLSKSLIVWGGPTLNVALRIENRGFQTPIPKARLLMKSCCNRTNVSVMQTQTVDSLWGPEEVGTANLIIHRNIKIQNSYLYLLAGVHHATTSSFPSFFLLCKMKSVIETSIRYPLNQEKASSLIGSTEHRISCLEWKWFTKHEKKGFKGLWNVFKFYRNRSSKLIPFAPLHLRTKLEILQRTKSPHHKDSQLHSTSSNLNVWDSKKIGLLFFNGTWDLMYQSNASTR